MKNILCWIVALMLPALPLTAGEAGDAVFAERGPWSLGTQELVWTETVQGPAAEGFRTVEDGRLTLSEAIDPTDGEPILQLTHRKGTYDRVIGPYPISGGDPVLTFFLERTARDMAALTGGSPFYIRNRMKDALFRGGSLSRDGDTVEARFKPFEGDGNADRMGGFETLELVFIIGDPDAPIREMTASTDGEALDYLNRLVMQ
ncbi:hypothetical protein [Paracoccus tegillarcae]|uniref:Uncharacterized protein n=1 Tax=Paracoccus tegillarcae TaxID=1529068 RepID=A0A2K9EE98_9RHOB|nr:hypothetical protein [Paracoccus tegillarcae]AUH33288.1 hypothetical protein CUV01_07705 [Paracoccus tegillarcae]